MAFTDDFNRSNRDLNGDNGWTATTTAIDTNQITNSGPSAVVFAHHSTDPGSADYYVQADVPVPGGFSGVVIRYLDDDNWYSALYPGDDNVYLVKCLAGSITFPGSGAAVASGSNTLKISTNGTTIKVYYNGVEKVSITDSDLTAKGFGGFRIDASATARLDNFEMTAAPSGPVISSVSVNPDTLNPKGGMVVWATDVDSDSTTEYGTTTGYGSSTATTESGGVTTHHSAVTGLSPSTLYDYLPHSNDGVNDSPYSTNNQFTTPSAKNRVVWVAGDSISYGQGLTHGTDDWPAQLQGMINHPSTLILNPSIGGISAASWLASVADLIITPHVGAGDLQDIAIVSSGHNDGDNSGGYDAMMGLCTLFKDAGFQVIVVPPLPTNDFPTILGLLQGDHGDADVFVDLSLDSRLQDGSDTDYFQDGVHPTVLGQTAYAEDMVDALDYLGVGTFDSVNPTSVAASAAGTVIHCVGTGTDWWDGMDFTATAGSVSSTVIIGPEEAYVTVTPPSSGTVKVSDQWVQSENVTVSAGGGGFTPPSLPATNHELLVAMGFVSFPVSHADWVSAGMP